MKRLWLALAAVFGLGLVVIVVILLAPKPPIPNSVKAQATSTILVPKSSGAKIDRSSVKYNQSLKLITMVLSVYGSRMILSEQPTPDSFTDIPQVYQKVVDNMQTYQDFDTGVGTVYLTRPPSLGGKQAAVLNTKGTLLFAKPNTDLSEDQWRKFFNSFVVDQ